MKIQPVIPIYILLPLIVLGFGVLIKVLSQNPAYRSAWLRRIIIFGFLCIAAIGPSIPGKNLPAMALNVDVIFVVDTTTSMGAEDYDGDSERIVGVRKDIIAISEKLVGARFGLISFDTDARMDVPMTTDHSTLVSYVKSLSRESSTYSKGSSIDKPLELLKKRLEKSAAKDSQRPNIVFYFGDGEQTAKEEPKSFNSVEKYISGGGVFGYGTSEGGKMKKYYGYGGTLGDIAGETALGGAYVQDLTAYNQNGDYDFPVGISKIDEQNLKKIAEDIGVAYQNQNSNSDVDSFVEDLEIDVVDDSSRQISNYANLYYIFAIPAIIILFREVYSMTIVVIGIRRLH